MSALQHQNQTGLSSPTSPTRLTSSSWYYSTTPSASALPPTTTVIRTTTATATAINRKKKKGAKKPRWNTLPPKQLEAKIAERDARQARAKRLAEERGRAAAQLGNGEFARNIAGAGDKKRRHRDVARDSLPSSVVEGEERAAKRQSREQQPDNEVGDTAMEGHETPVQTQEELDQAAMRRARELVAEEMRKAQAATESVVAPGLPSPAPDSMDVDVTSSTSAPGVDPTEAQVVSTTEEATTAEKAAQPAQPIEETAPAAESTEPALETGDVPKVASTTSISTAQPTSLTEETPTVLTEPHTTTAPATSLITEKTTSTSTTTTRKARKAQAPAAATMTKRTTRSTARKLQASSGSGEDTV